MIAAISAFVLILSVFQNAHSIQSSYVSNALQLSDCSDPLQCFLNTLIINVPDICEDVSGQTLCIKNFVCKGINIDSVPSTYIHPTTIGVAVNNLGTTCSGSFSYGKLIKGDMTAILKDTDVAMDLYTRKNGEFGDYMNLTSCSIDPINIDLQFSTTILDWLSGFIEGILKKMLNKAICGGLNQLLETKITDALVNKVDPLLAQIASSQPSPYPVYGDHYTNWNTSMISKLHAVVDYIKGHQTDLQEFLNCLLQGKSLDDTVKSLMTDEVLETAMQKVFGKDFHFPKAFMVKDVVPGISIEITSAAINGFNSLSDLAILEPLPDNKVVLRSSFALGKLELDLGVRLWLNSSMTNTQGGIYQEYQTVTIVLHNTSLVLDLVVALDEHFMHSLNLDQVLTQGCLTSMFSEISIPNLDLKFNMTELIVKQDEGDSGQLETDVALLIDNIILMLISPDGFKQLTEDVISGLLQGPIRTTVNDKLHQIFSLDKSRNPCVSHYPYDDVHDYIVWQESTLVSLVDDFINERIGYAGVNKLLNCATDGTGKLSFDYSMIHFEFSGLNSFYGMDVLSPYKDDPNRLFDLHSYLAAGYCPDASDAATCNPLKISIGLKSKQSAKSLVSRAYNHYGAMPSLNSLEGYKLTISLQNFTMLLNSFLKVDSDVLKELKVKQLGTTGCLSSSIDDVDIKGLNLNVTGVTIAIHEDGTGADVTPGISQVLALISNSELIGKQVDSLSDSLGTSSQVCANGGVAPDSSSDSSSNSDDAWKWELFILIIGCTASLMGLVIAYNHWGKEKLNCYAAAKAEENEMLENEAAAADESVERLSSWEKWQWGDSLLFHPEIPWYIRYLMPIAVLGDIALFIDSNLCADAVSVMVTVYAGSDKIELGSVFDFGLGGTVKDMWTAEVYPLAALIAFFSGAWPYIKLAAMFVCWTVPPSLLGISRRENVLIVLDALGKWSLIDFFVMVLMLCAFYFDLVVADPLEVLVTVQPNWGFYSFLLATMISLGIGHTILACHRLVTEPKVMTLPEEFDPRESLFSLTYEVVCNEEDQQLSADEEQAPLNTAHANSNNNANSDEALEGESQRRMMLVKVTQRGRAAMLLLIAATFAFLIAGTNIMTMGFEFKGLTGLMLGDDSKQDYSYVTVGDAVPVHSGRPNDFAIRWMQASYYLFGIGMPSALLAMALFIWTYPLALKHQRPAFVLTEVFNAWSALDVFCVAIAAALLEIQQFAAFIVGDKCDQINKILENFDEKLDGDDKCFDVVAYLKPNSWVMFMAAVLLIVTGTLTLIVGHAAVKQRLFKTRKAVLDRVRALSRPMINVDVTEDQEQDKEGQPKDNNIAEPLLESIYGDKHLNSPPLQQNKMHSGSDSGSRSSNTGSNNDKADKNNSNASRNSNSNSHSSRSRSSQQQEKKKSWWSKLTWHNFEMQSLSAFHYMHLVDVQYRRVRFSEDYHLQEQH